MTSIQLIIQLIIPTIKNVVACVSVFSLLSSIFEGKL
jgi:hypothetical protein